MLDCNVSNANVPYAMLVPYKMTQREPTGIVTVIPEAHVIGPMLIALEPLVIV